MKFGSKQSPLECAQCFSKIRPSDLVFDPTWPSFKLFWQSFMIFGSKLCPLECTQGFPRIWPSDLVFDPTWPSFELDLNFIKIYFWISFMHIRSKLCPLECIQAKGWRTLRTSTRTTEDWHHSIPKAYPQDAQLSLKQCYRHIMNLIWKE